MLHILKKSPPALYHRDNNFDIFCPPHDASVSSKTSTSTSVACEYDVNHPNDGYIQHILVISLMYQHNVLCLGSDLEQMMR